MTKDVTVIGAGVIGLCIALQLQGLGYQVSVIDGAGKNTQRCSEGNAGHFAVEQVTPLANWKILPRIPSMLLNPLGPLCLQARYLPHMLPWLCRFFMSASPRRVGLGREALYQLNIRALPAWERLLSKLQLPDQIQKRGHLLVFETESLAKRVNAEQQLLTEFGVEAKFIDQNSLYSLEPCLSKAAKAAIYFSNTAYTVSPHKLMQRLREKFCSQGGIYRNESVTDIRRESAGFTLRGTTVHSSTRVIVAAGVWSRKLCRQLGYKIPLEAERGYHLQLANATALLSRPVASYERSFIITPMEHGLRLAGTVELADADAAPNFSRADILLSQAKHLLDMRDEPEIASRWMGCRPSLPDSLPVIGAAPRHSNLFFAFGHQHLGLTQAAITAELVADMVEGAPPSVNLRPYRCTRF